MSPTIPRAETIPSRLSGFDEAGRVFTWCDRIFRSIPAAQAGAVQALLESGLVDELVRRGLLVESRLSDHQLDDGSQLIEHERVLTVTYPHEWTFSMLRDAALLVLEVNRTARRYGYQLKDCHGYNVLFHCGQPRYCDLGSLVPAAPDAAAWIGLDEFERAWLFPLIIWSSGDGYLARRILVAGNELVPPESYLGWRYPILRHAGRRVATAAATWLRRARALSTLSRDEWAGRLPAPAAALVDLLLRFHLVPFQRVDLDRLSRRLERLEWRPPTTTWAGYHDPCFEGRGVQSTDRFDRIVARLRESGARSLVDLGCNRGAFSLLARSRLGLERVVCVDADEFAVDALYRHLHAGAPLCDPVCMDILLPDVNILEDPPWERLGADVACALALTHHLLLGRRLPIDLVLGSLVRFARKQLFVEFMPLGLWDGQTAPPLPSWYGRDWFREALARHARVVAEEQLEPNRVLFVATVDC